MKNAEQGRVLEVVVDDGDDGRTPITALPDGARVAPELGEGAGVWLDIYTRHALAASPMTPRTMHQSAALWLASVAIARRLKVSMPFGDVYPNLFVLWIAPTTLYRKTTAMGIARTIALKTVRHLLAAQDTTPEAFLSDLSGREPNYFDSATDEDRETWKAGRNFAAQKGWLLDEMSGLMAASGREYNAGLIESLLRFYDCDAYYVRSTRGQGRIVVRNAYLSMLGASTPMAMSAHLMAERLWSMGWWARFAIITPNGRRPDWKEAQPHDEPAELTAKLSAIYKRLPEAAWPDPPDALSVTFAHGVFDAWRKYNKALSYDLLADPELSNRLHGSYGRLPVHALKIATILAWLDWPQHLSAPMIEMPHLARAITICEEWRASVHRALEAAALSETNRLLERVLYQVGRQEPDGMTLNDLRRYLRDVEVEALQKAVQQLLGLREIVGVPKTKGPGPRTTYFHLAGNAHGRHDS